MYDGLATEKLMESVERVMRFRAGFEEVKTGVRAGLEVVSVNSVYLMAGTPYPNGFVMNMQPSEAEAGFDVQMPPTADLDVMKKWIAEEWVPASGNMTYQIIEEGPIRDYLGRPLMTATYDTNPWWSIFSQAVTAAGGILAKPEILPSTTDSCYIRHKGAHLDLNCSRLLLLVLCAFPNSEAVLVHHPVAPIHAERNCRGSLKQLPSCGKSQCVIFKGKISYL
ncbi:Aminoacylase-1-like protein [Drosera capensis]